jgi:hypothetical protein
VVESTSQKRIAAILGTGRSGTTWLGSIINAHPRIAYRFEPFHRDSQGSQVSAFMNAMTIGNFTEQQIPTLYNELIHANPLTEKAPFFPKEDVATKGIELLWKASRILPLLRPLFSTLYTPRDNRLLVFKEVTFEDEMDCLLSLKEIPVIYLVRHPSATVASLLRGQAGGKMPRGRLTVVESLVKKHSTELAEEFGDQIDSMDDVELNAVLWRIDTEKAIRALDKYGHGYLLTYEQLCDDAYVHVRKICSEFGLDFHPQMEQFLDSLYSSETVIDSSPKDVRDSYFTVFRDPRKTKDEWKKKWSVENEQKVARIVSNSITMERCSQLGGW